MKINSQSDFCCFYITSSDKILVGVGVSHSSSFWFTVASTVRSIVGSAVDSAFGLAVESIGSEVTVTQM